MPETIAIDSIDQRKTGMHCRIPGIGRSWRASGYLEDPLHDVTHSIGDRLRESTRPAWLTNEFYETSGSDAFRLEVLGQPRFWLGHGNPSSQPPARVCQRVNDAMHADRPEHTSLSRRLSRSWWIASGLPTDFD
jgi:hypothetical protein